jgi:hypothetical protein
VKVAAPVPPLSTARVPVIVESVEEATQVGMPPRSASTKPLVVAGWPTMTEFTSVYKTDEGILESVVEPILLTLKSEVIEPVEDEEEMVKRF